MVLAWLTECEHTATHKWGGHHMDEVWTRHSLHVISSAVHFLYSNFPKKLIFSTTTSHKSRFSLHKRPPKKSFFGKNFQKNRSPKPRVGTPRGGLGRRADPPTGADRAIPKPGLHTAGRSCSPTRRCVRPQGTVYKNTMWRYPPPQ